MPPCAEKAPAGTAPRSSLTVPAGVPRMIEKARRLVVDEVVIDLEDAVPANVKETARAAAVEALQCERWRARRVSVRINGVGTSWWHADVVALAGRPGRLASLVVPKVNGPEDLACVARLLDGLERGEPEAPGLRLQGLIESAAGVVDAARSAAAPRVEGLILGYADLAADSRAHAAPSFEPQWLPAQTSVLYGARAHGRWALDGPHLETSDDAAFDTAVAHARRLGFDGKWAIHPRQLGAIDSAFAPSSAEIEHARTVVKALERAERGGGRGAAAIGALMVDEATRRAAQHVLARAAESEPRP